MLKDQAQKLRELAEIGKSDIKADEKKAKVITVTSGKGGVGKSNFVVNLAITLQKMGKKVLIFDADVGMGNDDILMGFVTKYNVYDVVLNNKDINEVIVNGPYGLKLLPAGSGLNKIEEFTDIQRDLFIQKIALLKDIDYLIMDTGAGISRSVLGFIASCEDLIVITTPEPTSLTDAYCLLKAVNHFKIQFGAKVVINRTFDDKEAERTFNKLKNAVDNFLRLDLKYLGKISDDRNVVQAVRKQEPFVISYPKSEATKDIENIAKNLIGEKQIQNNLGIQGVFRKIFNIFS